MAHLPFQFDFFTAKKVGPVPAAESKIFVWKPGYDLQLVRNPKARRYLLRLTPQGAPRLTVPRRGSEAEALRFFEKAQPWLLRRWEQWKKQGEATTWQAGTRFYFRGEEVTLQVVEKESSIELIFGLEKLTLPGSLSDYRRPVFAHLQRLAKWELTDRAWHLAREHGVMINRITVRAQKSRWGSCSARGTISLNWRLIQTPAWVADYIILHELMHRREMNHSARFWREVAAVCPDYEKAELWLKQNRIELRPLPVDN